MTARTISVPYLLMMRLWTPYLFSILYFPGVLSGSTGTPPLYLQQFVGHCYSSHAPICCPSKMAQCHVSCSLIQLLSREIIIFVFFSRTVKVKKCGEMMDILTIWRWASGFPAQCRRVWPASFPTRCEVAGQPWSPASWGLHPGDPISWTSFHSPTEIERVTSNGCVLMVYRLKQGHAEKKEVRDLNLDNMRMQIFFLNFLLTHLLDNADV